MFTPGSRKPYLSLAAIATAVFLYAGIMFSMITLSDWAEQEQGAFPFMQEDWLRYLLPSWFARQGQEMIMLAGPSTVRENLLYERFEAEFPEYTVFQGGISLGGLDDVTASLEYIYKTYGIAALPDIMILGISPRFISNVPAKRPFSLGLDRYSPHFSTRQTELGIELRPKGPLESAVARARFFAWKQPQRFRTACLALIYHWISGGDRNAGSGEKKLTTGQMIDRLFRSPLPARIVSLVGLQRIYEYSFSELLAWRISPYKYRLSTPMRLDNLIGWLNEPDSWWRTVHTWNPDEDEQKIKARLSKLTNFLRIHNIQLLIVNMPERDVSRVLYDDDNYQAYLDLVKAATVDAAFLDMREFLRSEEFHDAEHSRYPGSLRLTNEVIRDMKAVLHPARTVD